MGRIIVEALHPTGQVVESRRVFDKVATIGRSYSNDIILDDPFVSPQHLAISNQSGQLLLKDLSSQNGVLLNQEKVVGNKTVKAKSGDIVCIGRTRLKLLSPDHPVEPTQRMDKMLAFRDFVDRPWVPFVSSIVIIGIGVWLGYLENPGDAFWKKQSYSTVMAYAAAILSYAGLLSLYTFFAYKRSYFVRNLVVSNIGLLLQLVYQELDPFLFFWILNQGLLHTLDYAVSFLILLLIFWISVRLTKDSIRWKEFARLAWIPLFLILLAELGSEFSGLDAQNGPVYQTKLAPGMGPLTEPLTLDEFLDKSAGEFSRLPND